MEQIQYELGYRDFVKLQETMINKNPQWIYLRIFCGVMSVVSLFDLINNPVSVLSWTRYILLLAVTFYPYVILPLLSRKSYDLQKQLQGPVTITMEEDSISFKTRAMDTTCRWIANFHLTKDLLILYPGPHYQVADYIFKKNCQDEAQFQRAVRLAQKLKETKM